MKQEEFIFSVGFTGDVAIVDKEMMRKYGKCSTEELLKEGLYRAAFCSALAASEKGNPAEMQTVLSAVEADCRLKVQSAGQLMRLFGVFSVPDSSVKVKYL